MDVDEQRLSRVQENLHRLGLAATLVCADAANPPGDWPCGEFDRILVDAPCSASGVIRRHPDVKLLRREQDIQQLARQQLGILQGLWRLLRPGGTLLYATCSVLQEENSAVVQRFLMDQADAQLLDLAHPWGIAMSHGRQVLPSPDGPDGLFYARLGKVPGAI
jgi:16S rRNA (cytosine967-C5)-methyltransferase